MMQEQQELPHMTFQLVKVVEEKGKTFSEEGITVFLEGVNAWLMDALYKTCIKAFDENKAVKKVKMKLEFIEIISGD
jgi:hypothetical protein